MKFDCVIIGGGLSGLICGISLQRKGARCAIVSTGQSALYFSSGSFDLLNRLPDGTPVADPEQSVAMLPDEHPYRLLGDAFARHARRAGEFFAACGVPVQGDSRRNAYHLTPMGTMKPTWLTLSDFRTGDSEKRFDGKRVKILNFDGFLDFNTGFIGEALESNGAECLFESISLPEVDRLRRNPTEMRAVNIVRMVDRPDVFERFVEQVRLRSADVDAILVPAVFGLDSVRPVERLRELLPEVEAVPTMPPSVPGIRTQQQLRRTFEELGGTFMAGDTVVGAGIKGQRVEWVRTANHAEVTLQAEHFVLASGSFFSRGLVADMSRIREPLFDLDIRCAASRGEWYDPRFFHRQNYLSYGVVADGRLHACKQGRAFENLYVAGSVLGGFDPIREGCGAGVAILTALYAADQMK